MSENTVKLSIIIIVVSYERERCIHETLASVYEKIGERVPFELIVVNNDEKSDLSELVRRFPDVVLVGNRKNIGFGAANNLGARSAKGEILLFLNPDTEILSTTVLELVSRFTEDRNIGIIGSQLVRSDGKIQEWGAGSATSFIDIIRNNLGFPKSQAVWESTEVISCDWVAGTAMFIPKELFVTLGGFDENFFIYFEDADISLRARRVGKKVLYYPQFSVLHKGGESYSNKQKQKKHYYDSQEYYFKKHRPLFEYWLVKRLRKLLCK